MNDSELEKKLKAARELKFPADYPEDFSRAVLGGLRAGHASRLTLHASRLTLHASRHWRPRLAWGFAAVVLLAAAFGLGHWRGRETVALSGGILENAKVIRETLALFPNQVRAIVQDEHGLRLVLAERADVPDSPPLFVKICDGKNCSSLVTFSGQEIQIAGQKFTVLADGGGGIILEGKHFAWSSASPGAAAGGLKISARLLSRGTM